MGRAAFRLADNQVPQDPHWKCSFLSLSDLRSLKPTRIYLNLLNKLDAAKIAAILTYGQDRK